MSSHYHSKESILRHQSDVVVLIVDHFNLAGLDVCIDDREVTERKINKEKPQFNKNPNALSERC